MDFAIKLGWKVGARIDASCHSLTLVAAVNDEGQALSARAFRVTDVSIHRASFLVQLMAIC